MVLRKIVFCILLVLSACSHPGGNKDDITGGKMWHAIHLLRVYTATDVDTLIDLLPQMADLGINVIILEVDYNFQYKSHPELILQSDPITGKAAAKLVDSCTQNGITLIPLFQCLGHQSWAQETFPLLIQYPEFDLTPGAYPNNEGIYCREWDPLNPEVYKVVFALLDELINAFDARVFHVGMDEVFLLGNEKSPSTKGMDPAKLFAKAVNDIYGHLVTKRGVKMLMWADRLIDGQKYDFGEWQSSYNGTAAAIDMIPTDIIMSPWHYEAGLSYPSIPMFIAKGFNVLPASYLDTSAVKSLIEYSYEFAGNDKMLGHMFTTWSVHTVDSLLLYEPMIVGMQTIDKIEAEMSSK